MKKEILVSLVAIFLLIIIFAPKLVEKHARPIVVPTPSVPTPTPPKPIITPQPIIVNSYATAVQAAKATNKNLLLVFGAKWCDWCQKLETLTLPKPAVQKAISYYVYYHVDVDKEPQ